MKVAARARLAGLWDKHDRTGFAAKLEEVLVQVFKQGDPDEGLEPTGEVREWPLR